MDGDVSLKVLVEYVVSFLFVETSIDCCSLDAVGESVFDALFNEF